MGAVILQKAQNDSPWKPVAFASRTMTSTEVNYAQIEKEALGRVRNFPCTSLENPSS